MLIRFFSWCGARSRVIRRLRACLCLVVLLSLCGASSAVTATVIGKIEFRDITVADALRILSDQSGMNVLASEAAADIRMTLYLSNVRPMEVLEAMARTYNLWYQRDPDSGIIRVYTVREFRLGQVGDIAERTEIFTMRYPNSLEVAYAIRDLFGDRVSLSLGVDSGEIEEDLQDRFSRFDIVAGRSLGLGQSGFFGGGNNQNNQNNRNSRNNRFNNRNSRSNRNNRNNNDFSNRNQRRNGRGGQASYDDIKKTFVTGKQFAEDEAIEGMLAGESERGKEVVDDIIKRLSPIYVTVFKTQNRVLVRTRDPKAMAEIRDLVSRLDTQLAQLLLEVKILAVDLRDDFDSVFDFTIKAGDLTVAGLPGVTPFDAGLIAAVVSEKFEGRLQLLEQEGRITELATPMVQTSNQEVSRVFVGKEQPIVQAYSASCPEGGGINTFSNCIIVPNTTLRPIGTTLLLTPTINADRTVSIRTLIEQSRVADDQAQIPVQVGDELVDADIDVVQSRNFSGTVMSKDNQSVAIGGLIEEAAGSRERGTPLLKDLPFLGWLFRDSTERRERVELVIIIRPHVLKTPTEAVVASREFLEDTSVHPQALEMRRMMDIYQEAPPDQHGGYKLKEEFEEYDNQYILDKWRYRNSKQPPESGRYEDEFIAPEPNAGPAPPASAAPHQPAAQNTYVELTRHAARSVRLPPNRRSETATIRRQPLPSRSPVGIVADKNVAAVPFESWRKGGVYVTTLILRNSAKTAVTVDPNRLRGQWLAATVEQTRLAGALDAGSSTYLYVISAEPFHDALSN